MTNILPVQISGLEIFDRGGDGAGSLRARLQAAYQVQMGTESNPLGLIENLLAKEIARRAAQADAIDRALGALEHQAAQALGGVVPGGGTADASAAQHLAPYLSEQYEAITRQSIAASRGMLRAMNELRELSSARRAVDGGASLQPDPRFDSDPACCRYLLRRFQTGAARCRRCGHSGAGSWLAARRCWQCGPCRAQTCVRHDTVMARSHVPLTKWFQAIKITLLHPTVSTGELAKALGINRVATVRTVLRKIHAAIASDIASQLLADLDDVFFPG